MPILETPQEADCNSIASDGVPNGDIMLADGAWRSLDGMDRSQLQELQWEQEQQFARQILASPKGSAERSAVVAKAYDTICTILAAQQDRDRPLVMGFDRRYVRLVLDLLESHKRAGDRPARLFEIGFGSGALLKEVRAEGFPVGGLEVSQAMRDAAIEVLGGEFADQLLLGDLTSVDPKALAGQPSVVFWNDVFEHICPDEIGDYVSKIHELLQPGGALITITPNWLMRPSDVTADFCPLRTEARGLHLKEYRLSEVTRLLKAAGFRRVDTPLFVTKRRIVRMHGGMRGVKQSAERLLDHLPVRMARLACRGLGMSYSIAWK